LLGDAAAGARRFAEWARQQQIDCTDKMILTDENGRSVNIYDIKRSIQQLPDTTEQLLVYFAGHGVNIGYNEYWLLSDAPSDTQAAVNVAGSEILARYSGISHVLFISDACRTAADGISAQHVSGGEIFPNQGTVGLENPVDQFFACTLGRPALEIRDPNTTTREYTALYTTALLDGLRGSAPNMLDWVTVGQHKIAFVRPRPLKTHLSAAVPRLIAQRNLQTKAIQVPDAHIVSDPTAWIARLTEVEVSAYTEEHLVVQGPATAPGTAAAISSSLLQSALVASALASAVEQARLSDIPDAAAIADTIDRTSTPFGPRHFETGCGFKIRGAKIVEAFSRHARTEFFESSGDVVRVNDVDPPGASVLLVLDSGMGVVVPAIPDFITALTVADGELIDVAFDDLVFGLDPKIAALHAVASASTRSGAFRLEGEHALAVANTLKDARGRDPALAIYAAYAYDDFKRRDLIHETSECVRNRLSGAQLFDIALLAGELDGKSVGGDSALLSFVPLLAQGWALLGARRVRLPGSLADIQATLMPSVWTMFDQRGTERIRAAMQQGEVR
jgi:hypothetical protein